MSNPAAKQKFDQKKMKYIEEKEQEYTFKPQLNSNKYSDVPATIGGQGEEFSQNLKKKLK